jgi:hypothetical protein
MPFKEQSVRLHHAIDPLHVDRRCTALFASLAPEQRMNAPIAVGRLTGNCVLDLGQ